MLTFTLPITFLLLLTLLAQRKIIWVSSVISILFLSITTFIYQTPSFFFLTNNYSFSLDIIRFLLILITLWVTALIIIARQKILFNINKPISFISSILLLILIIIIAFSSRSLIIFYIFFEASLIPTLFLIISWGYQPERLQARIYLIIYTVTASLPLLISIIFLYKRNGHLYFLLSNWYFFSSSFFFSWPWWLILISAFLVKTPLFLVHLWLPKAHVEAPVAGSIILAGVLLKLGSYGLLRIILKFPALNKPTFPIILSISLIGGVITRFICVRQTDIKALIAYSSVRHIGLATAGILSNTIWGCQGALIILIAHGLCSSCLFSLANITYETINSRGIYITKGIITLFPSLSFWWFCFSACNIAAPPSINLAAEIFLISRSISISNFTIFPLSTITFIAARYSLYLYTSTQHGSPSNFSNSLSLFSTRNYSICLGHFFPLIFLVFKVEILSLWL